MRIGIHTSTAGGLEKAALQAAELGASTFQIFSASPRMWRAASPSSIEVKKLKRARERWGLAPLVVHDNYLINLASADALIRTRSIAAFRGELERALVIGAEYLVTHPGSYGERSMEEGILAIAQGLREAGSRLQSDGLTVLLENTAGQGHAIGSRFEELAVIRDLAAEGFDFKIGFCLDTCHCLAAGYDVASPAGLRSTLADAEQVLGLGNVPVIHANDSKTQLGSHVDRHEQIGKGFIGDAGFRGILNHPKLRGKAFILETPVEEDGDDQRNVDKLKSLCRKSHTNTRKSS